MLSYEQMIADSNGHWFSREGDPIVAFSNHKAYVVIVADGKQVFIARQLP